MPRYLVQRRISDHLRTPMRDEGAALTLGISELQVDLGVTWVQSYASADSKSTFSVYEGPDFESICAAVEGTGALIDRITTVSVVEFLPAFYR
ncbi:MAG: nickel-binding protein [Thermomicrobiales bacterium]